MPLQTFGLIALLCLTGCVQANSDASVLPALPRYTAAQQAQAADELDALPSGSMIARMMGDYAVIREQIRAAQ